MTQIHQCTDKSYYCMFFGILVLSGAARAGDAVSEGLAFHAYGGQVKTTWTIRQANIAIEQSRKLLGLEALPIRRFQAELVVLDNDNTPYLWDQFVGKALWHVVAHIGSFELPSSPPGSEDRYPRVVDVFLDPATGKLVKLRTRWPKEELPMLPEVSGPFGAAQMQGHGGERYHGFPDQPPKTSFLEALDAIQRGGGAPFSAKQIAAVYVLQSSGNGQPRRVWAVTLRGVRWRGSTGGDRTDPVYEWRYIVNDATGKYTRSCNVPSAAAGKPVGWD